MHHFPSEGKARDVGSKIVSMLFPEGDGRVPVISVTGTNGKTTVTRMIGHVLAAEGLTVGVTTTDGIWVGGRRVAKGDTTGPHSARTVLSDPTVEAAVLETARGGIARRGLGYDWSDVGVLTNIQEDHFGQDGIDSLEDLVYIKSLVAERVRAGGTLVLNADDERLARLAEEPRVRAEEKRVVYFSLRGADHVLIRKHLDAGGTAFFARDGWVVEAAGGAEERVVRLADVPLTLGGTAAYQSANVLACVAACRARGVAPASIASALASFDSTADNPGRANIFRTAAGGYVLLDYGHNAGAFAAVCRAASRWRGRRVTGVIGVPGDRSDELIERAGRIAARGFERIRIKEDEDPRGRRPGEVADLLLRAVRDEAPWRECSPTTRPKPSAASCADSSRARWSSSSTTSLSRCAKSSKSSAPSPSHRLRGSPRPTSLSRSRPPRGRATTSRPRPRRTPTRPRADARSRRTGRATSGAEKGGGRRLVVECR
jgi:cyanophycin synthetase